MVERASERASGVASGAGPAPTPIIHGFFSGRRAAYRNDALIEFLVSFESRSRFLSRLIYDLIKLSIVSVLYPPLTPGVGWSSRFVAGFPL